VTSHSSVGHFVDTRHSPLLVVGHRLESAKEISFWAIPFLFICLHLPAPLSIFWLLYRALSRCWLQGIVFHQNILAVITIDLQTPLGMVRFFVSASEKAKSSTRTAKSIDTLENHCNWLKTRHKGSYSAWSQVSVRNKKWNCQPLRVLQAGLVLKPRGLLVARGAGVGKQIVMSIEHYRSLLFIHVTFVVKDLAE